MMGFFVMGACYAIIGLIPAVRDIVPLFILVFGLSFFFVNFGPNSTSFLIPSEIYPTNIRASGHGISAAVGKVGAFIGAFCLPFILISQGLAMTMGLIAAVSFLGIFITLLIPEMKGISLDASEIPSDI